MSPFASWLASSPPDIAIEISPLRVSGAALGSRGTSHAVRRYSVESLPAGAIVPSLTSQNIVTAAPVIEAIRSVLSELGGNSGRVALVVPDIIAKTSLLKFERVPPRADDLEQLIRWQIRKSAPFSVDDAAMTYTAGASGPEGTEFLVVIARRSVVQDYERVCAEAGAHAGVVDLATLSVVNLFLAQSGVPTGDWLLVHMRPEYVSIVIVRDGHVIFFRNRPQADGEPLSELVHQTVMYHQDRLGGMGFERVFLGGANRGSDALEQARRSMEDRLRVSVDAIDPLRAVSFADRLSLNADGRDALSPLVGMLLRGRGTVRAA